MLVFTPIVFADETFKTHFDLAEQYYKQARYTNAIGEYQKALRINNLDNSARIGLINSYLARATYYINTLTTKVTIVLKKVEKGTYFCKPQSCI